MCLRFWSCSAAELARKLGVPTNRVTQCYNELPLVTGDTALRLDTKSSFTLAPALRRLRGFHLQDLYDLRLAQKKAGKCVKALPKLKRHEL